MKPALLLLPTALLLSTVACTADPSEIDRKTADSTSETTKTTQKTSHLVVFSTLGFTRMDAKGRVPGFNLDGKISGDDDPATCNKPDFTAPDGTKGIDNRFATIVPAIEQSGLGAVEGLLKNAVIDGGLLLMLQIDGLDSIVDDSDVTVRLRAGSGKPLLGTDGLVLAGQTFHVHTKSPESLSPKARVKDGWLHAGPFDALLPLEIFDVKYSFTIKGARIKARLKSDGALIDGLFGGGLLVDDLIGISKQAEKFEKGVSQIVTPLAVSTGDMNVLPNGNCAEISMALRFNAVSAFLWEK